MLANMNTLADLINKNAKTAQVAGLKAQTNAHNKALVEVMNGIISGVREFDGDLLIPSRSGGGIYRTNANTCSCPAGDKGRFCWHRALADSLITMAAALDEQDREVNEAPQLEAREDRPGRNIPMHIDDSDFDNLIGQLFPPR